jgi:hypothetical protein
VSELSLDPGLKILVLTAIANLIVHTKAETSQYLVFAQSYEQRTENPRVVNSVITPVNMDPESSALVA